MEKYFADWGIYFTRDFWNTLLGSDFNRGYMAALLLILILFLILIAVRFVVYLFFRTRKCKAVIIPDSQGDVTISRTAVENAVRNTVAAYPALDLRELKLFRKGKSYMLRLHCTLDGSRGDAFSALVETLRPALLEMLKDTFGITQLRKIRFVLEDYEAAADEIPALQQEENSEVQENDETDSGI